MIVDYLNCAHCGGRIRESRDDVCVSHPDTGEAFFFHADGLLGECQGQAYETHHERGGMYAGWHCTVRPAYWTPEEAEGLST
jgi:hypothetical protein